MFPKEGIRDRSPQTSSVCQIRPSTSPLSGRNSSISLVVDIPPGPILEAASSKMPATSVREQAPFVEFVILLSLLAFIHRCCPFRRDTIIDFCATDARGHVIAQKPSVRHIGCYPFRPWRFTSSRKLSVPTHGNPALRMNPPGPLPYRFGERSFHPPECGFCGQCRLGSCCALP